MKFHRVTGPLNRPDWQRRKVSRLSVLRFCIVFSTRYLLQHTLNNRPAVMESNFKCFIVVM